MKNYVKKFTVAAGLLAPALLWAQTQTTTATPSSAFIEKLNSLLGSVLPLLMTIALIVFFWGLVKYLMAGGDPDKAGAGKSLMIWGIITLFVMSAVWGLTGILSSTIGIDTSNNAAPNVQGLIPTVNPVQ